MTIDYDNTTDTVFDFDEDELIIDIARVTMKQLACPYDIEVSVSVVDADTIHELNRETRQIDAETDVLSFPMNEFDTEGVFEGETFELSKSIDPDTGELVLGDVVLCADRVLSQADEYGHTVKREFAFLIVHSLLHLCGFDHMEDDERMIMEDRQREILDSMNIKR